MDEKRVEKGQKPPQAERQHDLPLVGHFVKVVAGEHAGEIAAYLKEESDGRALIRFRDHNYTHDLAVVPVEDLRTTPYTGGR